MKCLLENYGIKLERDLSDVFSPESENAEAQEKNENISFASPVNGNDDPLNHRSPGVEKEKMRETVLNLPVISEGAANHREPERRSEEIWGCSAPVKAPDKNGTVEMRKKNERGVTSLVLNKENRTCEKRKSVSGALEKCPAGKRTKQAENWGNSAGQKISSNVSSRENEDESNEIRENAAKDKDDFEEISKVVCLLVKDLFESFALIRKLEAEMRRNAGLEDHFRKVIISQQEKFRRDIWKNLETILKGYDQMMRKCSSPRDVTLRISELSRLAVEDVESVISQCIQLEDKYRRDRAKKLPGKFFRTFKGRQFCIDFSKSLAAIEKNLRKRGENDRPNEVGSNVPNNSDSSGKKGKEPYFAVQKLPSELPRTYYNGSENGPPKNSTVVYSSTCFVNGALPVSTVNPPMPLSKPTSARNNPLLNRLLSVPVRPAYSSFVATGKTYPVSIADVHDAINLTNRRIASHNSGRHYLAPSNPDPCPSGYAPQYSLPRTQNPSLVSSNKAPVSFIPYRVPNPNIPNLPLQQNQNLSSYIQHPVNVPLTSQCSPPTQHIGPVFSGQYPCERLPQQPPQNSRRDYSAVHPSYLPLYFPPSRSSLPQNSFLLSSYNRIPQGLRPHPPNILPQPYPVGAVEANPPSENVHSVAPLTASENVHSVAPLPPSENVHSVAPLPPSENVHSVAPLTASENVHSVAPLPPPGVPRLNVRWPLTTQPTAPPPAHSGGSTSQPVAPPTFIPRELPPSSTSSQSEFQEPEPTSSSECIRDPTVAQKLTLRGQRLEAGDTIETAKNESSDEPVVVKFVKGNEIEEEEEVQIIEEFQRQESEDRSAEPPSRRIRMCAQAECLNIGVRICKGCFSVIYCSDLCQLKHWRFKHKKECDKLKELRIE